MTRKRSCSIVSAVLRTAIQDGYCPHPLAKLDNTTLLAVMRYIYYSTKTPTCCLLHCGAGFYLPYQSLVFLMKIWRKEEEGIIRGMWQGGWLEWEERVKGNKRDQPQDGWAVDRREWKWILKKNYEIPTLCSLHGVWDIQVRSLCYFKITFSSVDCFLTTFH